MNFNSFQRFIARILLVSLLLQSCGGGFGNHPLIPAREEQITSIQPHAQAIPLQTNIQPLTGQVLTAEGGHAVSFYHEAGELKANVAMNAPQGFSKSYEGLSVTVEQGAELAKLQYLPKKIQQNRIHIQLAQDKQPAKVAIYKESGLMGGMEDGEGEKDEDKEIKQENQGEKKAHSDSEQEVIELDENGNKNTPCSLQESIEKLDNAARSNGRTPYSQYLLGSTNKHNQAQTQSGKNLSGSSIDSEEKKFDEEIARGLQKEELEQKERKSKDKVKQKEGTISYITRKSSVQGENQRDRQHEHKEAKAKIRSEEKSLVKEKVQEKKEAKRKGRRANQKTRRKESKNTCQKDGNEENQACGKKKGQGEEEMANEEEDIFSSKWLKDYNKFVQDCHVNDLRQNRSNLDRLIPSFSQAIGILEFIEEAKKKYGTDILLESDHFFDLIIDICDIVNAQHPDFKERYKIFIEQYEVKGSVKSQLPFSLYSFDQIAQVFHYRKELFDITKCSKYMLMVKEILDHELPLLMETFKRIQNLNDINYPGAVGDKHLMDINGRLDKMLTGLGKDKSEIEKNIVAEIGQPVLKRLYTIRSMTHDYLTLDRIVEVAKSILSLGRINSKKEAEEKVEALTKELEEAKQLYRKAIEELKNARRVGYKDEKLQFNRILGCEEKCKETVANGKRVEEELRKAIVELENYAQQREAFLAGMVQIGEFATNKHLSKFIRHHMPTIPWENDGLLGVRNAIQHQDEDDWGMSAYFAELIDGTNTSINFEEWKKDLEILSTRVSETKKKIWGDNPKTVFERWLAAEIRKEPIYGVTKVIPPTPKSEDEISRDKEMVSKFRKTPLFQYDKQKGKSKQPEYKNWGTILSKGENHLTLEHFEDLREAAEPLPEDNEHKATYDYISNYLLDCLRQKARHLKDDEKELLVECAKDHINNSSILKICLGLLKKDQSYLTADNWGLFRQAGLGTDSISTINQIHLRVFGEMVVTRNVRKEISSFPKVILDQTARKGFAYNMLNRTTTHLYTLIDPAEIADLIYRQLLICADDYKQYNIFDRLEKIGKKYIFKDKDGNPILNKDGSPILTTKGHSKCSVILASLNSLNTIIDNAGTNGFLEFYTPTVNKLYDKAHALYLPEAFKSSPTIYWASLYSISVGLGALKTWIKAQKGTPPSNEQGEIEDIVEKLRYAKNFIGHGDLFRNMNNMDLRDIQQYILSKHLDRCIQLKLI